MKQLFLLFLIVGLAVGPLQAQSGSGRRRNSTKKTVAVQEPQEESSNGELASDGSTGVQNLDAVDSNAVAEQPKQNLFNPKVQRDPTLSPDDVLLLEATRRERELAAKKAAAAAAAAARAKELAAQKEREFKIKMLKYPELEVKGMFKIRSVIGEEVFFDKEAKRPHKVGSTFPVKGRLGEICRVKIVKINSDTVDFSYKGRKFSQNI